MKMNWHDLLFMHYRVPVEQLRRLIPEPLEIDTFEGAAWIGVVPFRMTGVAPRFVPPVLGFPTSLNLTFALTFRSMANQAYGFSV